MKEAETSARIAERVEGWRQDMHRNRVIWVAPNGDYGPEPPDYRTDIVAAMRAAKVWCAAETGRWFTIHIGNGYVQCEIPFCGDTLSFTRDDGNVPAAITAALAQALVPDA